MNIQLALNFSKLLRRVDLLLPLKNDNVAIENDFSDWHPCPIGTADVHKRSTAVVPPSFGYCAHRENQCDGGTFLSKFYVIDPITTSKVVAIFSAAHHENIITINIFCINFF